MFAEYPDLLSVADMEKALGTGHAKAYELIGNGRLRHMRIGRVIKIPR